MKILHKGQISAPLNGKLNYNAWGSITTLAGNEMMAVWSGDRYAHICPFGRVLASRSHDGGYTWDPPYPIMNTPLDDRDAGIVRSGDTLIATSFNNSRERQRFYAERGKYPEPKRSFVDSYLGLVSDDEEQKYLGATLSVSHDGGKTFTEPCPMPITSPHGPLALPEGGLLWVGRAMHPLKPDPAFVDTVQAWHMDENGEFRFLGSIDPLFDEDGTRLTSCEPHAILLEDGTVLAHIRVQRRGENKMLSTYQSLSYDGGKTWTHPEPILGRLGGAPSHLFRHSSGVLLATYGYREEPYGIKVMFSLDNGNTWETDIDLYINGINWDLGYPATVELKDGSLLTVFYAHPTAADPAVIMQQKWRIEK